MVDSENLFGDGAAEGYGWDYNLFCQFYLTKLVDHPL